MHPRRVRRNNSVQLQNFISETWQEVLLWIFKNCRIFAHIFPWTCIVAQLREPSLYYNITILIFHTTWHDHNVSKQPFGILETRARAKKHNLLKLRNLYKRQVIFDASDLRASHVQILFCLSCMQRGIWWYKVS